MQWPSRSLARSVFLARGVEGKQRCSRDGTGCGSASRMRPRLLLPSTWGQQSLALAKDDWLWMSVGRAGWRASVGHKCFQDCAAPVRCGGKGVAGKASGAKRLEWHRMAKPSPQQPSDAWATKTAGLPPVESPFPNRKRLKGAPERDCLGTHDLGRYCNTGALPGREKEPLGSLTPPAGLTQRGWCSSRRPPPSFPPSNRLPDLINIR